MTDATMPTKCPAVKVSNKRKEAPSSTSSPSSPAPCKSRVLEAVRDRLEEELKRGAGRWAGRCGDFSSPPSENNHDEYDEDEEARNEAGYAEYAAQLAVEAEEEEYYRSGEAWENYMDGQNIAQSVE